MRSSELVLFYGPQRIGRVVEEGWNFPNVWGQVELEVWVDEPRTEIQKRLSRFLRLSIVSLKELDSEEGLAGPDRGVLMTEKELEGSFRDMIESSEWKLIEQNGVEHLIMCPLIREDKSILWRWA